MWIEPTQELARFPPGGANDECCTYDDDCTPNSCPTGKINNNELDQKRSVRFALDMKDGENRRPPLKDATTVAEARPTLTLRELQVTEMIAGKKLSRENVPPWPTASTKAVDLWATRPALSAGERRSQPQVRTLYG